MITVARPPSDSSAHYYKLDGTPCHTVIGTTTGRPRPVTIVDAKKMGLLPGVSTILKTLRAPGLEAWRVEQAILSALTLPRKPDENEHEFALRVIEDMGKEAESARDLGSEIHAAMAGALGGAEPWPSMKPYIDPILDYLKAEKVLFTERVLIGYGYAGTADLGTEHDIGRTLYDVKSCKELPKAPWPEHRLQLSAYAAAFINSNPEKPVRVANIYISKMSPGQFIIHYHDDWHHTYREGFAPLLKLWQWMNNYEPTSAGASEIRPQT